MRLFARFIFKLLDDNLVFGAADAWDTDNVSSCDFDFHGNLFIERARPPLERCFDWNQNIFRSEGTALCV